MNKKAEELLKRNSITKLLLKDKKRYENQIARQKELEKSEENDYCKGLNGGVQIGFHIAAVNCKRTLELMLKEAR
ncbi:hypothetical protein [Sporanaerobacter acetigenes]|uniref:hypothetical protein n=1 Tax=Sporanaerobacter acetigenes TaxID=165813 RepID=UPI00333053E8